MRLDFLRGENVHHIYSPHFEVIRNKRAMATPPDCFRAHDRRRVRSDGFPTVMFPVGGCPSRRSLTGNVEQSLDSFLELLRIRVIGVPAERCVAPRCISRVGFRLSFSAQLREMFVT